IERDDTYRNNVAPYRSLVILTLIQVKIYGWSRELSRNLKRATVKILEYAKTQLPLESGYQP
ncbi:MAG: hypothetical protein LBV23_03670, partial [Deltaproteobacteria bacterium]|nr:hypothetical protein [Deltaproteobacteria bacterium]